MNKNNPLVIPPLQYVGFPPPLQYVGSPPITSPYMYNVYDVHAVERVYLHREIV